MKNKTSVVTDVLDGFTHIFRVPATIIVSSDASSNSVVLSHMLSREKFLERRNRLYCVFVVIFGIYTCVFFDKCLV